MKHHFDTPPESEHHSINQEAINTAYARAQKILSDPIDPQSFGDIYKDVDKDMAYVERREQQFATEAAHESVELQNRRKIGRIFEAIVFEHAELSN